MRASVMRSPVPGPPPTESGYTLIELMFVVIVLAIGILASVKLFPVASREQLRDGLLPRRADDRARHLRPPGRHGGHDPGGLLRPEDRDRKRGRQHADGARGDPDALA